MLYKEVKEKELKGRSGSRFPVALKWENFSGGPEERYMICNAAEGEPFVSKDKHVLLTEPERVVDGIKAVIKEFSIYHTFFYIRKDYFKVFGDTLQELFDDWKISFQLKEDRYVAGEETSAISSVEGKRAEPTEKPPFPTEAGINGFPTLVHNVETFYAISEIKDGTYDHRRFYSIAGEVENGGVFKLKNNLSITEILKETGNYPDFPFLVQAGGGAGGVFLSGGQLNVPWDGLGAVRVIKMSSFEKAKELKRITQFLMHGNCDKCTPCREGIYRINEMIEKEKLDDALFGEIILALEKSSYCPLGSTAAKVFKSIRDL